MKIPAPDDWNEEQDGYCVLFACIPNSEKWRAAYRGLFYQPTWWKYYDKEGPPFNPAIKIAKEVYEGLCMANCDDIVTQLTRIADALENEQAQQTKAVRELTAVVGSQQRDLTEPIPDNVDYTSTGVIDKLKTANWLAPDQTLADILANSLFGRYLEFPIPDPLTGTGISDILDDRIRETLERCLVMADASLFNPLGTKNMAETMETLLRRDKITDLEFLFTPNIVTVLEDIFYAKPQRAEDEAKNPLTPEQETGKIADLKRFISAWLASKEAPNPILKGIQDFILEKLDTTKQLSISEILLMLSDAGDSRGIANAIKNIQQTINLNNYNGCCDEDDCNCDEAETKTITLDDLGCEDVEIPVNGNGNGPV